MKTEPAIAIFTTVIKRTMTDLSSRIKEFNPTTHRGVFTDGTPFFLATGPDSLRGRDILSYEIYHTNGSMHDRRMIAEMKVIAEQRMALND